MNENLVPIGKRNSMPLKALFTSDPETAERIFEFFTARVRDAPL